MTESLRAHFVVATKNLRDPNFFKTVVLMVEHGTNGSMGLVLNRPLDVTVQRALEEHFDLPETNEHVYYGGPVEQAALFILHNASDLDPGEKPLLPDLFVGSTAEVFQEVVQRVADGDTSVKFRVFSGCAGWAAEQLEGELARGDWLTCPATPELILNDDPYSLWEKLLEEIGRNQGFLPPTKGSPEWN